MAGDCSVETCGNIFQTSNSSSNYGIDSDGRVGMYVEEKNRSWASDSRENDHQAVTIEVANDSGDPNWHISDKALAKLIELCVDICKRNGIKKLNYTSDVSGNLTRHNMFAATGCPGPYLQSKFPYIAEEVNKRLLEEPVKPSKPPINKAYKVIVTPSDGLNCRSGAGTGHSIVTAYPCGAELTITEEKDGWGKTDKGWVCLQYTKPNSSAPVVPPPPPSSKYTTGTYKVTADVLNVRTGAGTNYDWISFNNLSDNARSQIRSLSGSAANGYVKGMICDISQVSGNWGRTPSGWICLDYAIKI